MAGYMTFGHGPLDTSLLLGTWLSGTLVVEAAVLLLSAAADDGHSLALDGRCCWARVLDLLKTLSIGETTRERHRVQELGVGRLGSE